jgi:hypothetical protein
MDPHAGAAAPAFPCVERCPVKLFGINHLPVDVCLISEMIPSAFSFRARVRQSHREVMKRDETTVGLFPTHFGFSCSGLPFPICGRAEAGERNGI